MEIEPLLVQLEWSLLCKISASDFATKLSEGSASLDTIHSRLAPLYRQMSEIDNERPLVYEAQRLTDCKVAQTTYTDRINAAHTDISNFESSLTVVENLMDRLETQIEL